MTADFQAPASSWRDRARQLAGAFLSFLLPPTCGNCRQVGSRFCVDCKATVTWMREPICRKCGRIWKGANRICKSCVETPTPLTQIRSAVLLVDPVQGMIHKLKYKGMFGLAEPLAELMVEAWLQWETAVDLVIPIPLHTKRQKERNYNQAELLANHFSQKCHLPLNTKTLQRIRQTKPQVGLNASQRLENVQEAFHVEGPDAVNKDILLVDDVCTTGATLTAAANALLSAGAKSVSAYCLARAT